MFCSKCGAAIPADSAFCQSCGTPVPRPAVASAPAVGVSPQAGVGAIAYASNVTYAGFWLRFVAHIVDDFLVGFVTFALFIPFFVLMGGMALLGSLPRHGEHPEPAQIAAFLTMIFTFVGVAIILQWLYYAYLESGDKQGTWGKQMLGLYVTDLSGNRIFFGRASGRFFAKMITGLIPFWIGYIMAGFTERRQALHDMIASCLVLRH
ncbi:MAG: RDD family protein [Candidatus Acidiferrum sp.]